MASGDIHVDVPQRKRTAQACNQCRRRKTKCNGEQNCNSCAAFGFQCTYQEEVTKMRGPAYVAYLEKTVKELESQVESISVRSSEDGEISSSITEKRKADTRDDSLDTLGYPAGYGGASNATNSYLYGSAAGIEILRRMRVGLDAVIGVSTSTPGIFTLTESLDRTVPDLFYSPSSAYHVFSPPKDQLLHHINAAFRESFWFQPFVSQHFIESAVDRVYNTSASVYPGKDEIALTYAIAAIGEYLDPSVVPPINDEMAQQSWKGVTYFRTVQGLIDPASCARSILALQTVICMSIYLIATSALSKAHIYIGIAATAAVRMGLHLPSTGADIPQHERIMRKRTYRSLMAIDIYISSFLGLPCCLTGLDGHEDYTKQPDGDTIDQPHSSNGVEAVASATMDVSIILRNAMLESYFSGSSPGTLGIYNVPCAVIQSHNMKFDHWFRSIPELDVPRKWQLLATQSGAYAQMLYNSSFLHCFTIPATNRTHGELAATKCLSAAIQSVEMLQILRDEEALNEAHSFTLSTLAFAAIILLFVEFSGLDVPGIELMTLASDTAENLLRHMAARNIQAFSCYESLKPLYRLKQQLPRSLSDLISGTDSSWSTPSTDNIESQPFAGTVSFPGNTLHLQPPFDLY